MEGGESRRGKVRDEPDKTALESKKIKGSSGEKRGRYSHRALSLNCVLDGWSGSCSAPPKPSSSHLATRSIDVDLAGSVPLRRCAHVAGLRGPARGPGASH